LEETGKLLHLQQLIFTVLNIAHFRKQIKNSWRGLKCVTGGGRESSFCSSFWANEKALYIGKKKLIAYIQ